MIALPILLQVGDGEKTANRTVYIRVADTAAIGEPFLVDNADGQIDVHSRLSGIGHVWSFGDGQTGQGADAHHGYAQAGAYTVSLTVVGLDGKNRVYSQDVTVEAAPLAAEIAPEESRESPGAGLAALLATLAGAAVAVRRR